MKVLAFPKDPNPYQELLYRPLRASGVRVGYLLPPTPSHTLNLLLLPTVLVLKRLQGYTVFHLHWTYSFVLPWAGKYGRIIMQRYFGVFLKLIKMLGYKLVWTAHNALPHQQQFTNDISVRRMLGAHADAIIAHSNSGAKQLSELGIQSGNVNVIAHGNYIGTYPEAITHDQARAKLDLPSDAFVVLFFGRIDPYKNVPALLEAARMQAVAHHNLHVVIAGACKDQAIKTQLRDAKREFGSKLHIYEEYIPDSEVQTYFRAADIVALPFAEITTSGSAILALSFGLPIIAPRKGALQDMPESVGFFYDPAQTDGLSRSLEAALASKTLGIQRKAAQEYVASLSWTNIASQTKKLFKNL